MVWAESRASNAAFSLFERQACAVCHVVSKNDNAEIPWHVEPVRLTENWLPNAIFNHNKHQTMACTNCHAGDESEHSHDILIPDIGNCQQCHGGEESTNLIPNTCIDCHGFHEAKIETFNQPRFKNISQAINSPHKNTPEVKGEKGIDRDE